MAGALGDANVFSEGFKLGDKFLEMDLFLVHKLNFFHYVLVECGMVCQGQFHFAQKRDQLLFLYEALGR